MEDYKSEEGIEQEHDIGTHGSGIQKNGLRRGVEGVGHQGGLDHDQAVAGGLSAEHHAVLHDKERVSVHSSSHRGSS